MPWIDPHDDAYRCDRDGCDEVFFGPDGEEFPPVPNGNPRVCPRCSREVDSLRWSVCTNHDHPVMYASGGCSRCSTVRATITTHAGPEPSMEDCDHCGQSGARSFGLPIYDPPEGGKILLHLCSDCQDNSDELFYCYECEGFNRLDPQYKEHDRTKITPCPEHSDSEDEPVVECDAGCGRDVTFDPDPMATVTAHGRNYCGHCMLDLARCGASYCNVQWHPNDPEYPSSGMCPDCTDVNLPTGLDISHPAQWDAREDCECRVCCAIKGIQFSRFEGTENCNSCSMPFDPDSGETVSGSFLCHICYESSIVECEGCSSEIVRDTDEAVLHGDRPGYWCSDCAEDRGFWFCDIQCQRYFDPDVVCECGGVHSYRYRPDEFDFFTAPTETGARGSKPFFGIELEMEDPNGVIPRHRGARLLSDYQWAYPVHDGSLAGTSESQGPGTGGEYGFEMVTHPFTWRWFEHNWMDLESLLKRYADMGFRSWEGERCAMHVHVSRGPMSQAHQLRFINFIYGSVNLALCVGQRGYKSRGLQEYASFTDEDRSQLIQKIKRNNNPGVRDHYAALNTQYAASMEARWFRGTLNPKSFRKNLEFMCSVYHFTERYGHQSANEANYVSWLFSSPQRKEYAILADYLKANYLKRGIL